MQLLEASVVLTAKTHNPSILNKDWLEKTGITNETVGDLEAPPITTPAFSQLRFNSGIVLTLEEERFICQQVQTGLREENVTDVLEISRRFVTTLQHTPYTACGNNFRYIHEIENAQEFIVRHFMNPEAFSKIPEAPQTGGTIKTVHSYDDALLALTISPGTIRYQDAQSGEIVSRSGFMIDANFHRESNTQGEIDLLLQHMSKLGDDKKILEKLLDSIFEEVQ